MDHSMLSTILWVVAGALLLFYIARRRKRRSTR
jgi:hypothetical protein